VLHSPKWLENTGENAMIKIHFSVRKDFLVALAIAWLSCSVNVSTFFSKYTDTILSTTIAGLSAGQMAEVILALDNGGSSNLLQTWTANDLQSLTFNFGGGNLVATFNAPFDGGLALSLGDFMTDAKGALTSVPSSWIDANIKEGS
jgi:hypothetical protein